MLKIADVELESRLFLGSALYPSPQIMQQAISAAKTQVVTVSLRRQTASGAKHAKVFYDYLQQMNCHLLPNTAGCRTAKEAITTARLAREVFKTNWIKIEVIGDEYNLQPDMQGLLEATAVLIKEGFEVFPYCTDDLVFCQRLCDLGCRILMPWGAPIGSGLGLANPYALKTLRERLSDVTLIVDAGLGVPSHAAQAMEMGFDGVLLNSAVALAEDPERMARAFALAVEAGYSAYQAGRMPEREFASSSTPLIDVPFVS